MQLDAPKPLVMFRGRPLVEHALDAVRDSRLSPVVMVVGFGGQAVARVAPVGVEVVHNTEWATGIASSLRALIEVLAPRRDIDAVAVGLADQPLVGAEAYRRLRATYDASQAALAVATYGGERANPVLIARQHWHEAARLTGDEGARQLMRRLPVVEVPCDGTGHPTDIDTAADLAALEA